MTVPAVSFGEQLSYGCVPELVDKLGSPHTAAVPELFASSNGSPKLWLRA